MNIQDVHALLDENKNERGIKVWERTGIKGFSTYGIGVTQLKKLAKKIGRNHELALELWNQKVFDMLILATMVDDPKQISEEQVEEQIQNAGHWMLTHTYCQNMMPKLSFLDKKFEEWHKSDNSIKRTAGYNLLYIIARDDKKKTDDFFLSHIDFIKANLQKEENFVRDAMNNALIMIGSRSSVLNERSLIAAETIGPVVVDYGDNSCQAMDAIAHLSSKRIQDKIKKLEI